MKGTDTLRVAAWQGRAAAGSKEDRLAQVAEIVRRCGGADVDLLVLPECFLTGYFVDRESAWSSSIELNGREFARLCDVSRDSGVTLIASFNERSGTRLHNTCAVTDGGRCLGVYRKSYLYHSYHTAGADYPVFEKKGATFGVVICLDSTYPEPCRILARYGAKLIVCPMDNRVPPDHKLARRPAYYSHFVARSHENNCWFVSADVVENRDGATVCPGHTVVYDNDGVEAARSTEYAEELLVHDIPLASLSRARPVRLFGTVDVVRAYAATEKSGEER